MARRPISGIITIKDCVKLGYPFVEAMLSILPIVDEYLVADGGSTDETMFYLKKLQEQFPKIHIFYHPWKKTNHWKSFDDALNFLIKQASGYWIIEGQSDEFIHEDDLLDFHKIIRIADTNGFNSIRQPCIYYQWDKRDSYIYRTVRAVRKIPELIVRWGGDDFQIGEEVNPREGLTSHNVPPELDILIEIMHMSRAFPLHQLEQDRVNVEFLGGGGGRKENYERSKVVDWNTIRPPNEDKVLSVLPALMKGLSQSTKYYVREELFDKKWLEKTTGLKYEGV